MRITGLYCTCNDHTNPVDHYFSGGCSDPPMALEWIDAILASNAADDRHAGNEVTATRVLTCPRQVAIEDNCDNVADLRQMNNMQNGTMKHAFLSQHRRTGCDYNVRVAGTLFGTAISGEMDKYNRSIGEIEDWKGHSESAQNVMFGKSSNPEGAAQLNIYRLLLQQSEPDAPVKKMGLWHNAMTSAKSMAPAWFYRPVPFMSEEEIGALRPYGAKYTVREIVGMLLAFKKEAAEIITSNHSEGVRMQLLRMAIKDIPLVGREMWRGAKCNLYCAVKRTCDAIEGIASV